MESLLRYSLTVTSSDIQKNSDIVTRRIVFKEILNSAWFIPVFTNPLRGGIRTIFQIAQYLSIQFGTLNMFVICLNNGQKINPDDLHMKIKINFPNLKFHLMVTTYSDECIRSLPYTQISFCTLWTTAFYLLKYNNTFKKYYLIQDYEPMFYEAGSISSIIEQTYRFGFSCVCNSRGVYQKILQYSDDVSFFSPGVDRKYFYPKKTDSSSKRLKVVFYGRPKNPRNCFVMALKILKQLKTKLKDEIDIISVGADFGLDQLAGSEIITNIGELKTMQEVSDLYRDCDAGFVFMATPHPSYQPLEYMACGCIAISNINENNSWLLNAENSILVPPLPNIASDIIISILKDPQKKQSIIRNAYKEIDKYTWEDTFKDIYHKLME